MLAEENILKSNKLGNSPIGKLLFGMSLPAIIAMLVQSLYNIVDSIFVARISEKALDALAIVFPMQMLLIAFCVGIGVGTNALLSRKLGEKKYDEASLTAQTGLFISLICAGIFVLIGIFFSKPFMQAFTKDPETIKMGTQYLSIVLILSVGSFLQILCEKVFQATGSMKIPMMTQLIGAITNIILDPIFIFGYFGLPAMGIVGAAIATVIGQNLAMLINLLIFRFTKQDVILFFNKGFKIKKDIISGILKVGIPTIIMTAITSITVTILNSIIKVYKSAITVLGIYFKLQSFVTMPILGLNQGALPIMGYNYGANNKKRFIDTFILATFVSIILMIFGTILFQILPVKLLSLFKAKDAFLQLGILSLRIISISFVFIAINITMSTMFQSLGNGLYSLMMSLLRQIILLLPFAVLLLYFYGINNMWYCFVISEIFTTIIFVPISIHTMRKKFNLINKNAGGKYGKV